MILLWLQINRLKLQSSDRPTNYYMEDGVSVLARRSVRLVRRLEALASSSSNNSSTTFMAASAKEWRDDDDDAPDWCGADWGIMFEVTMVCCVVIAVAIVSSYV